MGGSPGIKGAPMSTYRSSDEYADLRKRVATFTGDAPVFTRADIRAAGVDESAIKPLLRRGCWVRLHHGVYVDATQLADATPERLDLLNCAAAQRALPVTALAYGPTAAIAHGLPVDRALLGNVHLLREPGHDARALSRRITSPIHLANVHLHAHRLPADPTTVGGVLSVDLAQAAATTALFSTEDWAVVTMDAAAWRRPDVLPSLTEIAGLIAHVKGAGTLAAAVDLVRAGAQTPLETLSRLRLIRCGIEEPQLQVTLRAGGSVIAVVDMLWPERRVVGEADGLLKYADRDSLVAEKVREDRIRDLGFRVVRWTWDEIMSTPQEVARRIQRASVEGRSRRRDVRGTDGRIGSAEGVRLFGRPA